MGDKREYEISFLLAAENESEIFDILNKYRAEIIHRSPISSIKLAYPIKKQNSAFFGFCQFNAVPEEVEKISAALKLKASILRFLMIKNPVVQNLSSQTVFKKPIELSKLEIEGPSSKTLSNELLEKKLEEILK
jgi:ribosomal protein S6